MSKKLPRYPAIPCTMPGRLVLTKSAQGKGLGEWLLIDALKRAWECSSAIASWAVIFDAIDDSAVKFYSLARPKYFLQS